MRGAPLASGPVLCALVALAAPAREELSRELRRELALAGQLLGAGRIDEGIEKLHSLIARFPGESRIPAIHKLLRKYGAGDEIRVRLVDRRDFHRRLKITEEAVLSRGEKALAAVRGHFSGLKPFFESHRLELVFYKSEARFRAEGGDVTSSGHFSLAEWDPEQRSLRGKVEWPVPGALTVKDRETRMQGVLTHELAHYVATIHFGRALPSPIDEGLATFLASRLNTEYYQAFRRTERQGFEGNARNALGLVGDFEKFRAFLRARRGLGRGDATIDRWYGLCYAVVDCLAEERIAGRQGSLEKVLRSVAAMVDRSTRTNPRSLSKPLARAETFLRRVVADVFAVELEEFHQALVQRVMKYRRM